MPLTPFRNIDLENATDEQIARLKAMTDDDLLRSAGTLDQLSVVESSRRLRMALHKEERAIKWLTIVLVVLTIILIGLGLVALGRPT